MHPAILSERLVSCIALYGVMVNGLQLMNVDGMDTMAYAGACLAKTITNLAKPVMLTGVQMPLSRLNSDCTKNLNDAVAVAMDVATQGGGIFGVFDGKILNGGRMRKIDASHHEAFTCSAGSQTTSIREGGDMTVEQTFAMLTVELKPAEFWDVLDKNGITTGRLHERGKPMGNGEYSLCVYVFIENDNGEFLISQRASCKEFPLMWETTGGNAVTGDDSLKTALKEANEELGVTLDPQKAVFIKRGSRIFDNGSGKIDDVWYFQQNFDITEITLAPDETCNAMWASRDKINGMIANGEFATWGLFSCIDELFRTTDTLNNS